jgi:SAM-dependent methyltransferase
LAGGFLGHCCRVTGIDLSGPVLALARQNLRGFLEQGQARLIQAGAADFPVDGQFGLAASTLDSLNMRQSGDAVAGCFARVKRALAGAGMFVFDLMTGRGLWQGCTGVFVAGTGDELYVLKSVYDGAGKAATRMTGLVGDGERWERFGEFRTPGLLRCRRRRDRPP